MRADTDMRSAQYCDVNGANCKTTAQMGGTDTNAITLCPNDQFLDGDGTCWTAGQISGVAVPTGMVSLFKLTTCPAGWSLEPTPITQSCASDTGRCPVQAPGYIFCRK